MLVLDLRQKLLHAACPLPFKEVTTANRHILVAHDSTRSPEHRLIFAVALKLPLKLSAHLRPILTESNHVALLDAHGHCPREQQVVCKLIALGQKLATLALFLPESEADCFRKASLVPRAKLASSFKRCLMGDSLSDSGRIRTLYSRLCWPDFCYYLTRRQSLLRDGVLDSRSLCAQRMLRRVF